MRGARWDRVEIDCPTGKPCDPTTRVMLVSEKGDRADISHLVTSVEWKADAANPIAAVRVTLSPVGLRAAGFLEGDDWMEVSAVGTAAVAEHLREQREAA